ncbi:MAG: Ig-like domain-containing protein [Patescibacteria group bacterium]
MIFRRLSAFFIAATLFAGGVGLALPVQAQVTSGLNAVGQTIILPSTNPITIAVRIINVALGLLGIILVALILYAGFIYMTSGGEAAKTTQAKKIITNAIIGLIIILSAWAITNFVIANLLNATQQPGGTVSGTGGGPGGGGFGGSGGSQAFQVKSITPEGNVPIRNVQVKMVFTRAVDQTTVNAITIAEAGKSVAGTLAVNGSVVSFTPSAACPAPNTSKFCFDGNADFTVTIGGSVRSTQGQTVSCGFGASCKGTFHTGDSVDTQPPSISLTFPTDGMKVQQNFIQDLEAQATDDSGIATVEFFDGSNSVDTDGPNATSTPLSFTAHGSWDTAGAALGLHTLSASANDIDTNTSQSGGVAVMVRPANCFNGQQDANLGETGIDCGGDPNSANYCGACSGGACTKNADCSSGFCINGFCAEKPVIQTVSPLDGQPGTFVTVKGVNFGYSAGTVTFLGGPGAQDDLVASAPAVCVSAGATTWGNTEVIVAVPAGAASGPIEIKNSASGLTDDTNDTNGPQVPNFVADNTVHPGLCALNPNTGTTGSQTTAIGQGFGGSPGNVEFGTTEIGSPFASWTDPNVTFTVPVVNSAPYEVSLKVGAQLSNPVTYTVQDKNAGAAPEVDSIDPAQGPQQAYVTLVGKNFGFNIGTVVFTDSNGQDAIGDTSFPAQCSAGFWRDTTITVKFPSAFKNNQPTADGNYQVKVVRPDLQQSNTIPFALNSKLPQLPGICAIEPAVGPAGTQVQVYGERFGALKPSLTFSLNQQALISSNTSQQVTTNVPDQAQTGPVQLKDAQGNNSNKVNFDVRNCNEATNICGPNEQCCATGECLPNGQTCGAKALTAEFAWQTSTGVIPIAPRVIEECRPDLVPPPTPSPSPWDGRTGGSQAPVDAVIMLRFSLPLDPTTVNAKAFQVLQCTSASNQPCATTKPVAFKVKLTHENSQQDDVKLTPNSLFTTSTTYLVNVLSTVSSAANGAVPGAQMDPVQSCGTGKNGQTFGYCFRFETSGSTQSSTVGGVVVIPSVYNTSQTGIIQPSPAYEAEPLAAADKCIVLDCNKFNWNWFTGEGLVPRATVSNIQNNGLGACDQDVTAISETGQVPVNITAQLVAQNVMGTGNLFINFIPPSIVSYFPNCDQACVNAAIWVLFNEPMDPSSIAGNVVIRQCKNEQCVDSELGPPLNIPPNNIKLKMGGTKIDVDAEDPSGLLMQPGQYYHVLLKAGPKVANGGIRGTNGLPLTGLNAPNGFVWTFRVKLLSEGAVCTADHVTVDPAQKYESTIGATQLFDATAFGKPDECSASGEELVPTTGTNWSYDPNPAGAADIYQINNKLVDTGGNLPNGCSGTCQATGSYSQFGKVAICGNGIIETTDAHYCINSKTPNGHACQLLPAGAAAGEECEPSIDGNSCDIKTCLFRVVANVAQGGTCGNGVVDVSAGEACDFGPTCDGGSTATSTTPVPENTPCLSPASQSACTKAGGTCAMHDYRGCSADCRHLGATAGHSICGNGDVLGDGKDCDDGNSTDGDGCSAQCLHEASQPTSQLSSICGNGVLEPGETCEAAIVSGKPVFPAGCSSVTCLHTGTIFCGSSSDPNCCGNGKIEGGEDCDDGNHVSGDGCSSSCLLEGSSARYTNGTNPTPSFCGNGIIEQGEQCEVGVSSDLLAKNVIKYGTPNPSYQNALKHGPFGAGDGQSDDEQLGVIVGNATPDPDSGKMSSTFSATLEGKTGTATYGLQCGFTEESECAALPGGADLGLDKYGCCAQRPKVQTPYPQGKGVCRNVQIKAIFQGTMDISATINSIQIDQQAVSGNCPSGTTAVVAVANQTAHGVFAWIAQEWHRLVAWFTGGNVALAQQWCSGGVTGQLAPVGESTTSTEIFTYTLDNALDAQTVYRVRFLGDNSTTTDAGLADNSDVAQRLGIKTDRGVVHPFESTDSGDLEWTFKTGDGICAVNVVTVEDTTATPPPPGVSHPYLFTNANDLPETRQFLATAQSIQNGAAVALSTVKGYAWEWDPWTTSDKTVVTVQALPGQADTAAATSAQKNGDAVLTATLQVATDTINVPSTASSTVQGTAPVAVLVCENPWPSLSASPFRDANPQGNVPSSFQPGDNFFAGPFYNFSTMYCRDAGTAADVTDDVPALEVNQIPQTSLDKDRGILRQYLFTYPADTAATPAAYVGLQKDGIGMRIISNPEHLSAAEWYREQGFKGSPKVVAVDGYPAVQDGTTVYVAASNMAQPKDAPIYSNIYILSENPDAGPTTRTIYDQMLQYLTFNINILKQSNVCVDAQGAVPANINGGQPVQCSADWECFQYGRNDLHCDSTKLKLTRDSQRMSDFQSITQTLEAAKSAQGYPQATGGTFLRNVSTSLWSSWVSELGKALGTTLPKDPVNHFLTCGECSTTSLPCQSAVDCPDIQGKAQTCNGGYPKNGTWTPDPNIDPTSCWDQTSHEYICPNIPNPNGDGVSRVYQYQSIAAGVRYNLGAEFEIPPTGNPATWWTPTLPNAIYTCNTTSTHGNFCTGANPAGDASCRACAAGGGSCKTCASGPQQGQSCSTAADCSNSPCTDTVAVIAGACQQTGGSYQYNQLCVNVPTGENGVCGDGVINTGANPPETCEVGMTKSASCTTSGGKSGVKQQICNLNGANACQSYIDDPLHPQCVQAVLCGDGVKEQGEQCDEGALNGTYGHCNTSCTGYAGYCGDGQLSPGETCDDGTNTPVPNGQWENSLTAAQSANTCSLECNGLGPYCGDGVVNGTEQCDGTTITTQSALCSVGKPGPCTTDADCGTGGKCGGGTPAAPGVYDNGATPGGFDSCAGIFRTVGGFQRQTQHTQSCGAPGTATACTPNNWTVCKAVGTCGDGVLDTGEECDNGTNNSDTGACTTECKKNVCGDGKTYEGTEECDAGAQNGQVTCSADYNSMCLSCSTECKFEATAGGYCGNGVVDKNSPEQCDGQSTVPTDGSVTCQSLGYDYAADFNQLKRTDHLPGICYITAGGDEQDSIGFSDDTDSSRWNVYSGSWPAFGANITKLFNGWIAAGHPFTQDALNAMQTGQPSDPTGYFTFNQSGSNTGCTPGVAFQSKGAGVTCTNSCSFGGCYKCSDVPGTGVIEGRVYDAVFQQVVPSARVSLLYKGVAVDQTYTDDDGGFKLSTLNTNPSCSSYRIVIDMYEDNLCTAQAKGSAGYTNCDNSYTPTYTYPYDIDESLTGGYFPYTSDPFTVNTFSSVTNGLDPNGMIGTTVDPTAPVVPVYHIDIFPRPENGHAYVAMTWKSYDANTQPNGLKDSDSMKMEVILPTSDAFAAASVPPTAEEPATVSGAATCTYKDSFNGQVMPLTGTYAGACTRAVTPHDVGFYELTVPPYTRLMCLHRYGDVTGGWINPASNGCPIEGTTFCEGNEVAIKTGGLYTTYSLSNLYQWELQQGNSAGAKSRAIADANDGHGHGIKVDCADGVPDTSTPAGWGTVQDGDGIHVTGTPPQASCSADPQFDDCRNASTFGPLTAFLNYEPWAVKGSSPIAVYLESSNSTSDSFSQKVQSTNYDMTAYFAYTTVAGDAEIRPVSNPTGNGYAWHIANIDPKDETFTTPNVIDGNPGQDQDIINDFKTSVPNPLPSKPINDGLAVWNYSFQGAGNNYCILKTNHSLLDPNPAVKGVCYEASEKTQCESQSAPENGKYTCGAWPYYYNYNW